MDDDTIIKERLQVDERILRRISKRLLHDPDPIDVESQKQDILQYQFNIKKLGMMIENHARETQNYLNQTEQLKIEIEEEKRLVDQLRQQLVIEKDNVIRRQGYDVIAKKILHLPAVEETKASMMTLQTEIDDILRKQKEMDTLIEARKADIRSYLEAGQDLVNLIQRDLK